MEMEMEIGGRKGIGIGGFLLGYMYLICLPTYFIVEMRERDERLEKEVPYLW